ncbi:hypothetical protein P175DRAFT_099488 [Aspergillus ochraceoroseus IBT 24754]|uniref:Secreted protein n=1 Tax=Aspergillus ochraceoroseus IBT 24754 TaxID=1392256 RepID=A0A2T5LMW0_9EURO|nr:uncharacterized protein P175DRAFT_099488 [Aspergillus ochraceoroseus IBT 24754]PTU17619.1 hypothetical protein P175DRAFT_099488 [Aspergillus ochraceoroseus IBT 24754]
MCRLRRILLFLFYFYFFLASWAKKKTSRVKSARFVRGLVYGAVNLLNLKDPSRTKPAFQSLHYLSLIGGPK